MSLENSSKKVMRVILNVMDLFHDTKDKILYLESLVFALDRIRFGLEVRLSTEREEEDE